MKLRGAVTAFGKNEGRAFLEHRQETPMFRKSCVLKGLGGAESEIPASFTPFTVQAGRWRTGYLAPFADEDAGGEMPMRRSTVSRRSDGSQARSPVVR